MHVQAQTHSLEVRRRAARLSRERLGALADGISAVTVWRIERRLVQPHPSTVAALARALGCQPCDIVANENRHDRAAPSRE
jgi:transcriptional regulator with XRE-family HTH domain